MHEVISLLINRYDFPVVMWEHIGNFSISFLLLLPYIIGGLLRLYTNINGYCARYGSG